MPRRNLVDKGIYNISFVDGPPFGNGAAFHQSGCFVDNRMPAKGCGNRGLVDDCTVILHITVLVGKKTVGSSIQAYRIFILRPILPLLVTIVARHFQRRVVLKSQSRRHSGYTSVPLLVSVPETSLRTPLISPSYLMLSVKVTPSLMIASPSTKRLALVTVSVVITMVFFAGRFLPDHNRFVSARCRRGRLPNTLDSRHNNLSCACRNLYLQKAVTALDGSV